MTYKDDWRYLYLFAGARAEWLHLTQCLQWIFCPRINKLLLLCWNNRCTANFLLLHKMHFWLIYDWCKTSAYKCLITHFVYEVNSCNTPKCCHFQPLYVQSVFFSCFTKHRNLIWKKKKKKLDPSKIWHKCGVNEIYKLW